jgi:hypothetical protein
MVPARTCPLKDSAAAVTKLLCRAGTGATVFYCGTSHRLRVPQQRLKWRALQGGNAAHKPNHGDNGSIFALGGSSVNREIDRKAKIFHPRSSPQFADHCRPLHAGESFGGLHFQL